MILSLLQPDPSRAALRQERARLFAEIDRMEHRLKLEAEALGLTVEEALAVARWGDLGLLTVPEDEK